jgi:hypothetical protein
VAHSIPAFRSKTFNAEHYCLVTNIEDPTKKIDAKHISGSHTLVAYQATIDAIMTKKTFENICSTSKSTMKTDRKVMQLLLQIHTHATQTTQGIHLLHGSVCWQTTDVHGGPYLFQSLGLMEGDVWNRSAELSKNGG